MNISITKHVVFDPFDICTRNDEGIEKRMDYQKRSESRMNSSRFNGDGGRKRDDDWDEDGDEDGDKNGNGEICETKINLKRYIHVQN